MAVKKPLQVVTTLQSESNEALEISDREKQTSLDAPENLTLEQIVADELLDSIDWKAVNKALLAGVQRRLISWFIGGNSSSMIATNEIEAIAIAPSQDGEIAA
jgi:hypothetical protein